MSRTIDEINDSINSVNSNIVYQNTLIQGYEMIIQKNDEECEALKRQRDILMSTEYEVSQLISNLQTQCSTIKGYSTNNGFASGFLLKAEEEINSFTADIKGRLCDMVSRIDENIRQCENNIANAQNDIASSNSKIEAARNDLEAYNLELNNAQNEEMLCWEG